VKTKNKNVRRDALDASNEALRRLARAPESALQIYEFAESLYMRDGDGKAMTARMSLADIEQVGEYLRQTEKDIETMKKQFLDLATIEGRFQPEKIPIGF